MRPIEAKSPDGVRRAELLYPLAAALFAAGLAAVMGGSILGLFDLATGAALVIVTVTMAGCALAARAGHGVVPGWVVIGGVLVTAAMPLGYAGVQGLSAGGIIVAIALAGAMFGARSALVVGITGAVTVIIAWVLSAAGWVRPLSGADVLPLVAHAAPIGFAAAVVALTAREHVRIRKSLEGRLSDLRQTRRRYEELVELSPSGMAYLDDRGVIRIVNAAMEQITGRPKESLVGRRFDQLDAVPEWQATGVARTFEAGMHNGSASAMRVSVQRPDGAVRTVDAEVRRVDDPSGLLATMVDVTEREAARAARGQLEQERGQAQRLEALGRLAGGVAHDFNNLLTVVTTAAHLASTHDALPEDVRLDLDDILAASTKAAELTRQLLAFGRQQALEKRVVDGSQLLGGLSRMIGRLIGEEIEIEVRSSAAACPVLIDPGQLEQVLVNLAVNARDAMRDGGRLTMSVRRSHDVPAPGQWVEFRVQDTGHGMDAETRAKIFEPFFTTKERGRGTGLGLAMVHGIVQQLDGQICVESAPGEGTTISVFLPVHQGQWEDPDSISEVTPVEACRKLNILLVEDEDAVRAVLRRGLERTGHRLMTARGVDEGVGAWLRSREVDLLITDVFLGDGLGPELVSRLKASGYTGPVLYLTGYAGRSLEDIDLGMAEVLRKPVRPGLLRARVARIAEILRSR